MLVSELKRTRRSPFDFVQGGLQTNQRQKGKMRQYEITYLVSDEVPEGNLNKITGELNGYISGLGGKVIKEDIWGRRKLAYPIKKQDFATYVTVNFNLLAEKTRELEREIKLMSEVVRHLFLVTDYGEEELALSADEIVKEEEIKEVVGGEESFEAIEGETEESRDLMAKRKDEEAPKEKVEEEEITAEPEQKPETPVAEVPAETTEKEEKKTAKKEAKPKKEKAEKSSKTEKKPTTKPAKKEEKTDEAERLSKLNEELDDILKDEL